MTTKLPQLPPKGKRLISSKCFLIILKCKITSDLSAKHEFMILLVKLWSLLNFDELIVGAYVYEPMRMYAVYPYLCVCVCVCVSEA